MFGHRLPVATGLGMDAPAVAVGRRIVGPQLWLASPQFTGKEDAPPANE